MKDDIFEEDLWEEDMFEDESLPSEDVDDDTQYVLELMQRSMDLCEEAEQLINRLIEINNIYGEDLTGISKDLLEQMLVMYEKILPELVTGENEEKLIQTAAKVLNTSTDAAEEYVNDKRTKLLERMDENTNK